MTESRYRQTLHRWAEPYVPEGGRVVSVEVVNVPGRAWSSWTFEEGGVVVNVGYRRLVGGVVEYVEAEVDSLGEMLTQLFAIEDA